MKNSRSVPIATRAQTEKTFEHGNVKLASKSAIAEESSNTAYYIAGASLIGAAVVFSLLMTKKDAKAIETPLLAADDDFKAQMRDQT